MLRAFMYKFLCEHKFSFFWDKLLKNVITGPYGRYMFSFVKNKQKKPQKMLKYFPECCTILHSHNTLFFEEPPVIFVFSKIYSWLSYSFF